MIGSTISHFRILDRLGEGGMGVVYRARDERLERDVALKFLPADCVADERDHERVEREARTLSRLNHPAIATIYELGREGGRDFLVMEYVPGETLERRLASGPLAEKELAALGEQIALALGAAHEQNVVHCDLKPGNVVVTATGQAKVLDFGIARLLRPREEGAASTNTSGSAPAGTLPYMAPEQLMGDKVDGRADLYALGALLFRMSTARLPFEHSNSLVLANQIINSPAPPPGRFRADLSPRLEEIILKCLEKDRANRYQSAADLAVDLRRAGAAPAARETTAAGPRPIRSLAVLPLENLSGDPAQEFFADGMTESLIATLAQIGALCVISRTSAMQYKGVRKPLPEIARALNVDAVVEGSVLRSGDRVRITAQLIEASSDRNLWAQSYERGVGDVLALQSEVARAIAEEIRVKLTPGEKARLAGGRPVNPEAHDAYLRGRYFWSRRTEPDLRRAIEYFGQAIAHDPEYALAHSGLADAWNILGDLVSIAPQEASARARAAVSRALEIDPQLAEAHTSMAFIRLFYDWDWEGSERSFRQAIALKPGYATAHQWYAEYLNTQARFDEAIVEARGAQRLDPLAFIMGTTVSDVLFFWRRFDEAIEELKRVIEMEPGFVPAHSDLGRALAQNGRHEEAIDEFLTVARLSGADPGGMPGLGHAYAAAGRADEARAVLGRLKARAERQSVSSHAIAVIHVALGEHEDAFHWLDRACREHDRALVWMKVHPRLDPVRADARFAELLRRVGLDR